MNNERHISRDDFPLLTSQPELIYLDNAATTQKPNIMMEGITHYYMTSNANVGRGIYPLAEKSEELLAQSRDKIAKFFGSSSENLIFTSGATDALNQAAFMCSQSLKPNDVIVVTIWDHHANILPWQRIAEEKKITLKFIDKITDIYNPENLGDKFWKNVKVLAMPHVTNTTGNIFPVEKWTAIARSKGVISVIDGAQAVSSMKVNIQEIDADFYAFSAHKLYGPMGLGCLFTNSKMVAQTNPLHLGGGIIEDVFETHYILKSSREKFEAGTPDVASAYGFAETLSWLDENNWEEKLIEIKALNQQLIDAVKNNPSIRLLTDINYPHSSTTTIVFDNVHSHDVGTFLSNKSIAVRVGKHCAYPLHRMLKEKHSVRFSLGIYNTQEEIDKAIEAINQVIAYFND